MESKDQGKEPRLTGKQRAFIDAYLGEARFNGTKAARIAKYKGNDVTLQAVGSENLRKPLIASEIARRRNEHCASANEVLDTLTTQMRGSLIPAIRAAGQNDLADELEKQGADKVLKKIEIKRSIRRTKDDEEIEETTYRFEIHDPQAAAVHVGKVHKLFTEKHEIGGLGGGSLVIDVEFAQERAPDTPEET